MPLALLLMDRCDVLLSARLAAEARANALAAVAELEAAGMGSDLAEARLLAAQAELLAGDTAAAREHALQADPAFARQGRPAWAALARAAAARAAWMEVERRADARTRARVSATEAVRVTRRSCAWRRRWPRRGGRSGRSMRPAGASRRSTRG